MRWVQLDQGGGALFPRLWRPFPQSDRIPGRDREPDKRVRPITGAVIPAFNHPIKLAGELAMLDNICNGRLDVGFGRAFIPEEYAAYGLDMQESRARFDEGVAVIKRLWTEARDARGPLLAVQGRAFHAEAVSETASTDLGRGDRGGGSFVNAAKNGYHVMIVPYAGGLERTSALVKMYRQVWRESGHAPGTEQVQMSFHAYVAETRKEAVQGFIPAMRTYLDVFTEAVSGWEGLKSGQYVGYEAGRSHRQADSEATSKSASPSSAHPTRSSST